MLILTRKPGQKTRFKRNELELVLSVVSFNERKGTATFQIHSDEATEAMIEDDNGPPRTR